MTHKDKIQLLFGNKLSMTEENLLNRMAELKWPRETLGRIVELGYAVKPDWNKKTSNVHYERRL